MPVIEIPRRTLHVLIVEDEPRLRDLLLEAVPDMGFPATGARNAEEALRLMRTEAQDILILDLQLPGMGGMELFEQVRHHWPETQVIVLTGYGDLATAQHAIRLDVVEFLSKPCHLRDVELALDRARRRAAVAGNAPQTPEPAPNAPVTLADLECQQILSALRRHGGNRTAAAAELGISRRTLHYRLVEYRAQGHSVD